MATLTEHWNNIYETTEEKNSVGTKMIFLKY